MYTKQTNLTEMMTNADKINDVMWYLRQLRGGVLSWDIDHGVARPNKELHLRSDVGA